MLSAMMTANAFFCFGNSASFFNISLTKTSNLMKKVNFKRVLMTLSVMFTFLFVGGLTKALAQQVPSEGIQAPAQGSFVNTDQAILTLDAEITQLGNDLNNLPQGSPIYNATRRKALYYRGIYMELQNGNSVAESIGSGFAHLLNNVMDANGASKSVLFQLRQDAIALLSN